MQALEYVIFGVIVAVNLSVGLFYSFRRAPPRTATSSTTAEVFLGNRRLRMLPLAASSVASVFSSTGLVAFPAHFYAYGMHMTWCSLTPLFYLPLATQVVVPVLYKLGVTSIFEYIRLRFNSLISLTACAIYIILTQSIGAISIFAASLTLVTVFKVPLLWCNIGIGLCGTIYTALGGLRGVVWTDCMQLLIIIVAPGTVITKIFLESLSQKTVVQPLNDFNFKQYIAETALTGSLILVVVYIWTFLMAFALIVWFRGCDPTLLGDIKTIDQILPYYIMKYLVDIPGLCGLFLAGVVCAATSTVSSITNSQAAILYVDVIAPRYKMAEANARGITRGTAFVAGLIMTAYSSICVYLGPLIRVFITAYSACAAPFVGMCVLAVLFPFVHSKGAGTATLLVTIYQIYHMVRTITSGKRPQRMPVSLDFCPNNFSSGVLPANITYTPATRSTEVFFIFRLSAFWSSFFSIFATILIAMFISAITGEMKTRKQQRHLSSDALMRLWRKFSCKKVTEMGEEVGDATCKRIRPNDEAENTNLLMQNVDTIA